MSQLHVHPPCMSFTLTHAAAHACLLCKGLAPVTCGCVLQQLERAHRRQSDTQLRSSRHRESEQARTPSSGLTGAGRRGFRFREAHAHYRGIVPAPRPTLLVSCLYVCCQSELSRVCRCTWDLWRLHDLHWSWRVLGVCASRKELHGCTYAWLHLHMAARS